MTNDEWPPSLFFNVLEITCREEPGDHAIGCKLYDPERDEEHDIVSVADGIVTVIDPGGRERHVSGPRLARLLVIPPVGSALWRYRPALTTTLDAKRALATELGKIGLPASLDLAVEDLKDLLDIARTDFSRTTGKTRHRAYIILKKMELSSETQAMAFRAGRRLVEAWNEQCTSLPPADLLIHLAYYRRWTKATRAALEASECLEGPRFRADLSAHDRCILATERAAALMDQFEQEGIGLDEAGKYVRYSAGANGGLDTEQNRNTRMRYDMLRGGQR